MEDDRQHLVQRRRRRGELVAELRMGLDDLALLGVSARPAC